MTEFVSARMASIAPRLFGRSLLASPKCLAGSLQHSRAMHFTYVPDAQAPVDGEQIRIRFACTYDLNETEDNTD